MLLGREKPPPMAGPPREKPPPPRPPPPPPRPRASAISAAMNMKLTASTAESPKAPEPDFNGFIA
jgi:hypothetical protein